MVRITVMLPEEHKSAMEEIAQREDRNLSWVARKAIQEYIEKHKEEE